MACEKTRGGEEKKKVQEKGGFGGGTLTFVRFSFISGRRMTRSGICQPSLGLALNSSNIASLIMPGFPMPFYTTRRQ